LKPFSRQLAGRGGHESGQERRDKLPAMIRIELQLQLKYEVSRPGADFVFNIHPALTRCQSVRAEQLRLSQDIPFEVQTDACGQPPPAAAGAGRRPGDPL
jgi:hypothetical protein